MTSTVKVNNVQASDGGNIINQCGTNITIGASGDTIALASGASQTGFGRTGTVDWQTTPKTGDFTAVNGEGYFVNTTSGAVVMTMPSGSAGAIVSIQDYNKTFDSNNFTVTPAAGQIINGGSASASLIITTEGQGLTFVYVDGTVGWKTVHENEFTTGGSSFIVATGGTITNTPTCRIHTFTGPGNFEVTSVANCAANNLVSYMVVAGGGAGGTGNPSSSTNLGGAGGAGGFREVKSPVTPYTASPLDGYPSSPNRITVTAQTYTIAVGGGGTGAAPTGSNGPSGSVSTFSTITSAGGGGGGGTQDGIAGGSGGAGGATTSTTRSGGAGNTPPVSPAQGFAGGSGNHSPGSAKAGGGGGATAVGQNGVGGPTPPDASSYGLGGAGATTSITNSPVAYSGGGGGSSNNGPGLPSAFTAGGTGGGGSGAQSGASATNGSTNTGGGGGGGGSESPNQVGGNGGSGIVIIRYKKA